MPSHSKGPVFVVGANRSGTTLMRLLLNSHSSVAIPEEIVYLGSRMAGVPVERWREPGLSETDYSSFVDRFLESVRPLLSGIDPVRCRKLILDGPHDFRRPYEIVLSSWAALQGKPIWGEKTPGNLYYADILLDMFPSSRFIYMMRDPRAGISSMQDAPMFSDDIVFNALAWKKHVEEGRDHLERSVPADLRIEISYEHLVQNPKATLKTVCSFLGLSFESGMLSFYRTAPRFMKEDALRHFNRSAAGPVSVGSLEKWRSRLDARDQVIVEAICRDAIHASGFEPETTGAGLPVRTEIALKKAYWTIQSFRHRDVRHFTVQDRLFARSRSRLRKLLPGLIPTRQGR